MNMTTGQVVDTINLNPSMRNDLIKKLHRDFVSQWLRESIPFLAGALAVSVLMVGAAALLFGVEFDLTRALLVFSITIASFWAAYVLPFPSRKAVKDTVDALLSMERLRDGRR